MGNLDKVKGYTKELCAFLRRKRYLKLDNNTGAATGIRAARSKR